MKTPNTKTQTPKKPQAPGSKSWPVRWSETVLALVFGRDWSAAVSQTSRSAHLASHALRLVPAAPHTAALQSPRPLRGQIICPALVFGFWFFFGVWFLMFGVSARAAELNVTIQPRYQNRPLAFDQLTLTNSAHQTFSITRLDFLLSDFALHQRDGAWIEQTNWQAFLSLRENRSTFEVKDLASGSYDKIRFHVGLRPEINHSKPEKYPADHPLNPVLNGLHWGWAGGYVFWAIEGNWKTDDAKLSGYSFHLGNDWQLMTVEKPLALELSGNQSLQLALDLERLFDFKLAEENSSTHSRKGDDFATGLKHKVESAFTITAGAQSAPQSRAGGPPAPGAGEFSEKNPAASDRRDARSYVKAGTPATTHPYRFTFSAQFPIPELPRDNPLTDEGVELGRRLFNEKLLSINNEQSCASCHVEQRAFSDPKRFSRGAEGKFGTRQAMPIFNLAWKRSFFWDGRAPSLRDQVVQPIQNPIEMHETLEHVVMKLQETGSRRGDEAGSPSKTSERNQSLLTSAATNQVDYPAAFETAFGTRTISAELIARAIEQFLFSKLSYDSKFDRALDGRAQLTDEEKRGFELFITEYDPRREQYGADCFHCHGGPLFQSQSFGNNGLDTTFTDLGRFDVTKNEADKGKFAVPSLRNVAVSGPYMHDGRFTTLEEVVEHYTTGMKRSSTLDPNLAKHPDGGVPLSAADKKALVAFLKTLTDMNLVEAKVAERRRP